MMPGLPGQGPLSELFEKATGMPSPDKLLAEIQRLNSNMEKMAPDLHKIATSIDGLSAQDIRGLTQVLQHAKIAEATSLLQKIYNRIWGRGS